MRRFLHSTSFTLGLSLAAAAHAALIHDLIAYASLGAFNASGAVFVNTDTLTMGGDATAVGVDDGGVAVFTFSSIQLAGPGAVYVLGSRPFAFHSQSSLTIDGTVNHGGNSPGANGGDIELGSTGALV